MLTLHGGGDGEGAYTSYLPFRNVTVSNAWRKWNGLIPIPREGSFNKILKAMIITTDDADGGPPPRT